MYSDLTLILSLLFTKQGLLVVQDHHQRQENQPSHSGVNSPHLSQAWVQWEGCVRKCIWCKSCAKLRHVAYTIYCVTPNRKQQKDNNKNNNFIFPKYKQTPLAELN